MPRSSRHESHREHKHGSRHEREQSDSEERGSSRYKRPQMEETAGGRTRFPRNRESERRKSSCLLQPSAGKDYECSGNGDASVERTRKWKEKAEDSHATDQWNGCGEDDFRWKGESVGPVGSEMAARASRRHDRSPAGYEESGGKVESGKRQSGNYSSRCKSSSLRKDAKERDRERGSEKERKVHGSRHESSDDLARSHDAKTASFEEDRVAKKDKEISERQMQDKSCNIELHEEHDKRRRSDCSVDRIKWQGHGRDTDDRRLSYRGDYPKNASYMDGRCWDDGHRYDRHQDEADRYRRHRDDGRQYNRHRDERSSRDHTSDRSDIKRYRDETKSAESRYQNNKLLDSDYEGGPYVEDHSAKHKDTERRKMSFDEDNDHSHLKYWGMKVSHGDMEKSISNNSNWDLRTKKARLESQYPHQVDSNLSNNHLKNSPSSSAHAIMGKSRLSSKQADSTHQELLSEDASDLRTTSIGDVAGVSGGRKKSSDSRSLEKSGPKDTLNSGENLIETDRTQRSDGQSSPVLLAEKSSSTNDCRYSNISGSRRSTDYEDVVRNSSTVDDGKVFSVIDGREQERPLQNPVLDSYSHRYLENHERASVGPSSNWNGHFFSSSPGHLPPLPPARYRVNCPSLGSYENDNRHQMGYCKPSSRYRRSNNLNTGRGQGNAWKSGSSWLSPIPNSFLPFQHGPQPPRYHSPMHQFPAPPLFGMRPSIMNNASAGVSYHMHEAAVHFSGHIRPYEWDNPVEDSCPQFRGWDASNGMFGDDSHFYGKPDWDQNRPPMGSQGGEMNADTWKGENGTINIHFPQSKEPEALATSDEGSAQAGPQSCSELVRSESTKIEPSINAPSPKNASDDTLKSEKKPKLFNASSEDGNHMSYYLSKLEISTELACLELYNQCKTLLGKKGISGVCNANASKLESQTTKDENKVVYKRSNFILPSLFPTNAEAVFQRAKSLYQKTKVEFPSPSFCCKEGKDYLEASNMEKVEVVGDNSHEEQSTQNAIPRSIPEEEQGNSLIDAEGDLPSDAKEQRTNISVEDNTDIEMVGNHLGHVQGRGDADADVGVSLSGDAMEQRSDVIADAIVFVEGSQAFEAVMPECRVNLSWRLNSAKSTH